jgi:Omp85 superfamily domain
MNHETPSFSATSLQAKQDRLAQLQHEQRRLERQLQVQQFAAGYEVQVAWPAHVRGSRRTDPDLVQHRLLEAGMLYEVPTSLKDVTEAATRFVSDLERSQCFKAVRVEIGGKTGSESGGGGEDDKASASGGGTKMRNLTVHLQEANWYRLHAGGGVKTSSLLGDHLGSSSSTTAFLPTAELECSVGLRNLTGCLDTTSLQYTLDSQSIATVRLQHQRPLYSALPSPLSESVLAQATGSQIVLEAQAGIDTVDHTWTRSYREFQRLMSLRVSHPDGGWSAEWSLLGRDLVPQRHATVPYAYAASKEVVAASGPNVRHAFTVEYAPPSSESPTSSTAQLHGKLQLATPPGDVGFCKVEGGFRTSHSPLQSWLGGGPLSAVSTAAALLQVQSSFRAGYLHRLDFGGLTGRSSTCLSDRFYVGGPIQLRGFGPCGIGPRASPTSTIPSPGDALGGDFYYSGTLLASVPPNVWLPQNEDGGGGGGGGAPQNPASSPFRLFGFANIGTCVGHVASTPILSILHSTRASVGVGLSTNALGPMRLEVTYALPLRYGPRDIRKTFQFGMGISI